MNGTLLKWMQSIAYGWGLTSIFFMTIQVWAASMNGWFVVINYNYLNEGMLELVIFSAATFITILYMIIKAGQRMEEP